MDTYKVIIVGPSGVGKSSMTHYLRHGKFLPALEPTVGAAFHKYTTRVHGIEVTLEIWDTAGSPRYQSVLPMYIRESKAVILVYDVTHRDSMSEVESHWLKYLEMEIENLEKRSADGKKVVKYLVANKIDLLDDLSNPLLLKGQNLANKNGYRFLVASARSGENVFTLFNEIAIALVEQASTSPTDENTPGIFETLFQGNTNRVETMFQRNTDKSINLHPDDILYNKSYCSC